MRAGAAVALGAGAAGLISGDRRPGPEVWSYGTRGVVHQILLADTTLYAVDDRGWVYAMDARTGESHWARRVAYTDARPWLGILPGTDPGLYLTGDKLYALYSATGEERWRLDITALGTPAVSHQAVCCVARDTDGRNLDELTLVEPYLGERITLDRMSLARSVVGERDSFTAPAVADDGTIVLGGRGGVVHGLDLVKHGIGVADARDHKILRLPGHARFSPAAPLVTQGIAYLGTATKGGLVAVDLNSMKDIWTRRLGLDGETWSTPAVGDRHDRYGLVYATGYASVHAVDRSTGEPAWNYYHGSPTPSSPAVANDVLYVLTRSGELIALDAREGGPALARRAYAPFGGGPVPAPVAAHGLVHFATADRVLRAVPQARARAT
ncbi:PQQ-binding-like beta-propeller repeat protein [Streptomyces aurantiacus]|uniref:outer membrane protein assembly factor BamB family protein n=1 Tax=Streptomyces aurantiacus TaxID=47760 RepID=UPI00216AB87D|nr:PQQ-binding-like beta-propeller repeat protein [Streptomyces aurantiacus]